MVLATPFHVLSLTELLPITIGVFRLEIWVVLPTVLLVLGNLLASEVGFRTD